MKTATKKHKKKRLGPRKINELLDNLDFDPILKDQVRQVRWLYKNSNRCTKVYDERLVRVMVHRLKERIKELEEVHEIRPFVLNPVVRFC